MHLSQDLLWDFSLSDDKNGDAATSRPTHKIVSDKVRGVYVTNLKHVAVSQKMGG